MRFYHRHAVTAARVLLGLILLASGVVTLIGLESPYTGAAAQFLDALAATGYMLPLLATLKILTAASLLLNRYAALMLVAFFPASVNMVLFHLFLDPSTIAGALVLLALNLYLAGAYKERYRDVLRP